jgi:hypothetical protein
LKSYQNPSELEDEFKENQAIENPTQVSTSEDFEDEAIKPEIKTETL